MRLIRYSYMQEQSRHVYSNVDQVAKAIIFLRIVLTSCAVAWTLNIETVT